MIAELVPLKALVVVEFPLAVMVEFPALEVMVDELQRISSQQPFTVVWQNTYSEVVVAVPFNAVVVLFSAVVVAIAVVDVRVRVWLPDAVVIVVALESVVEVPLPVSVVVAIVLVVAVPFAVSVDVARVDVQPGPTPKRQTPDDVAFPESVDVTVALTESVVDVAEVIVAETFPETVEESERVEEAMVDEQPSPIPKRQIPDEVALEDVAFAESVADALMESVAVTEPLEEEPELVAVDDALLVQPSPMPRIQTPLEVALAEAEDAVDEPLEEEDAVNEPLEEEDTVNDPLEEDAELAAVDDALSLLVHPSSRPRIHMPLELALAEAEAEDELEASVVAAVPDAVEEPVALAELEESDTLLSVADAVDDALLLDEQSPRPRIQIPPLLVGLAELVADESEAEPELVASVDDADGLASDEEAELLEEGAEVVDAEDAEEEVDALRDVDVAGTSAVVPGGQPCVAPRSGIQNPPCPPAANGQRS